jgi:DNA polymerase-4
LADKGDLADVTTKRRLARQTAIDGLREKFGAAAVTRGRGLPR